MNDTVSIFVASILFVPALIAIIMTSFTARKMCSISEQQLAVTRRISQEMKTLKEILECSISDTEDGSDAPRIEELYYFYDSNDSIQGPLTTTEMCNLRRQGKIEEDTQVNRSNDPDQTWNDYSFYPQLDV